MTSRRWVFTLNNPTAQISPGQCQHARYCSWQEETGANGTVHYQGYIELNQPSRLSTVRSWLPTAHWERAVASRDQARDYTRKEETRTGGPWEWGVWEYGGQGSRNDINSAVETLRQYGLKRVAEEHGGVFVKYHQGFKVLSEMLEERPTDPDFVPRPWQQKVLEKLAEGPNDRQIIWVTDTEGGRGKSRLARHLLLEHGAIQLEGRLMDMAYMYNKEPIVVFDITRGAVEHSNHLYSMAEKLKNGCITSTKYNSQLKIFSPPHVIFFSNTSYLPDQWTADRVHEIDLGAPDNQ